MWSQPKKWRSSRLEWSSLLRSDSAVKRKCVSSSLIPPSWRTDMRLPKTRSVVALLINIVKLTNITLWCIVFSIFIHERNFHRENPTSLENEHEEGGFLWFVSWLGTHFPRCFTISASNKRRRRESGRFKLFLHPLQRRYTHIIACIVLRKH